MTAIADTQMTDTFTKFVADHNSVKNRLGLANNNGETSNLGAVAIFDGQLNTSLNIAANQRAVAVNLTIPQGITVTVAPGGAFVVL
jgi:hypothetical protein